MPRISLSLSEIDELISAYKSSLKKLRFQIDQTAETIKELQGLREYKKAKLASPPVREKKTDESGEDTAKRKPGRKPIAKKPKRRKKADRNQGYRLSEWDDAIIGIIRDNQKPMISSELIAAAMQNENLAGQNPDETFVKGKVARSLQKLANKRGTLRKHPTRGKGFSYGLGEWFFAKTGKLKKAYQ